MREALFIFIILIALLGLTAFRYRKQIAGVLGVARMLKEAKRAASEGRKDLPRDGGREKPLVNCVKCGVWVPQDKSLKSGNDHYCSDACFVAAKR